MLYRPAGLLEALRGQFRRQGGELLCEPLRTTSARQQAAGRLHNAPFRLTGARMQGPDIQRECPAQHVHARADGMGKGIHGAFRGNRQRLFQSGH
ncbi:hypothetical protein D3C76_922480 [compost metagenome]